VGVTQNRGYIVLYEGLMGVLGVQGETFTDVRAAVAAVERRHGNAYGRYCVIEATEVVTGQADAAPH
jgi:hypothetical protein